MTAVKLEPYDSAEHLKTDEARLEYLRAALESADDDPSFFLHALNVVARAQNMSQIAKDAGVSRAGVYKALSDDGNPAYATVASIVRAMGYRLDLTPV